MSLSARKILERVQTWPPEDLEELADRAREIGPAAPVCTIDAG